VREWDRREKEREREGREGEEKQKKKEKEKIYKEKFLGLPELEEISLQSKWALM
jgi:hypothetical protein